MADRRPGCLATPIQDDLRRKMVFLGGPRQAGRNLAEGWADGAKQR